jgi:hypothetical protein
MLNAIVPKEVQKFGSVEIHHFKHNRLIPWIVTIGLAQVVQLSEADPKSLTKLNLLNFQDWLW